MIRFVGSAKTKYAPACFKRTLEGSRKATEPFLSVYIAAMYFEFVAENCPQVLLEFLGVSDQPHVCIDDTAGVNLFPSSLK